MSHIWPYLAFNLYLCAPVDSSKTVAFAKFYSSLGTKNSELGEKSNWRGCVDTPADGDKDSSSFLSHGRKTCGHFVETGWCAAPLISNAGKVVRLRDMSPEQQQASKRTKAEEIDESAKLITNAEVKKPQYIARQKVLVGKRTSAKVPDKPPVKAAELEIGDVVEVGERKFFNDIMQIKIATVVDGPKEAAGYWVSTEDAEGNLQLGQSLPLTPAEIMQTAAWHAVHNMPSPASENWHSDPEVDLADAYENCCACGGGRPTEGMPVYVYYHVVPRDYYSCSGDDEAQCYSRIAKTIIRAQEMSNARCGAFQGRELVQWAANEHHATFRPDKAGSYENVRTSATRSVLHPFSFRKCDSDSDSLLGSANSWQ